MKLNCYNCKTLTTVDPDEEKLGHFSCGECEWRNWIIDGKTYGESHYKVIELRKGVK